MKMVVVTVLSIAQMVTGQPAIPAGVPGSQPVWSPPLAVTTSAGDGGSPDLCQIFPWLCSLAISSSPCTDRRP